MLSRSILDSQRRAQRRLMPGKADVEHSVMADDGYGGQSETWEALQRGVAFRIMPGGSLVENMDRLIVARLGSRVGYQATLEADVPVTSAMRLRQTFPVQRVLDILQVQNADASHLTALRLLVAESEAE